MDEKTREKIEHPAHYQTGHGDLLDVVGQLSFPRGNAIKYIFRAGKKPGESALEDLKKARFYLDWEILRLEAEIPGVIRAHVTEEDLDSIQRGLQAHPVRLVRVEDAGL